MRGLRFAAGHSFPAPSRGDTAIAGGGRTGAEAPGPRVGGQQQCEELLALARWAGQVPSARAGIDHAELIVAGHEVTGVWVTNLRTGQEATRDEAAQLVFTLAFDVEVGMSRDGY